jgi:hypothetical protein
MQDKEMIEVMIIMTINIVLLATIIFITLYL